MNQAGPSVDSPSLKGQGSTVLQGHLHPWPSNRRFCAGEASRLVSLGDCGMLLGLVPGTSVPYGTGTAHPGLSGTALAVFFLLCALLLLAHILRGFVASAREWSRWREAPTCPETFLRIEHRILYRGNPQEIFEHCNRVCEEFFPRFYAFHRLDGSATVYYFFAKRGTLSLFALPWLKAGFVPLFLGYSFSFGTSPDLFDRILLWAGVGALCAFWLPAVWILVRAPYQKIWMSFRETDERLLLTLLCCSASSEARLNHLAKALMGRLLRICPPQGCKQTHPARPPAQLIWATQPREPPPRPFGTKRAG